MKSIRFFRRRADLTQSKLAVLMGVTLRTVQRWEAGIRSPDAKQIEKLASIFGCRPGDLFESAPVSVVA